jgi:3-oxoacyl-[acyl-carrier protein] reductase
MEKVALVTGASRGIGQAIAALLAREGYAVCLNYCQNRKKAESLASQLTAEGCRVMTAGADVSDRQAVETMVHRIEDHFSPVSLLVNNAGVAGQSQFQDVTEERWHRFFAVNVDGAFHAAQAVLPAMLHAHEGCIVNMASIWGLRGASCEVAYSCTKAAVIGLTRSLAAELAPSHIRVNCVAPGVIRTEMLDELPPETLPELAAQTPMERLGTPEDIARAVSFLASDKADFITGQVLTVDGGFIL